MRYRTPYNSLLNKDEYNQIEIGSFPFDSIENKQKLDIMFLVFLPFYRQETLSPMVTQTFFDVPGEDSGAHTISQSGGMWTIDTMRTQNNIIYRGQGIKLNELQYTGENDDLLKKVLEKFRKEIMVCNKIKQCSDVQGNVLNKKRVWHKFYFNR